MKNVEKEARKVMSEKALPCIECHDSPEIQIISLSKAVVKCCSLQIKGSDAGDAIASWNDFTKLAVIISS